jgi:hypothetical protein
VVPKTVVVRAAGPWRCRGEVYHHESITNLGSPARNSTILGLSKLRTRLCERSAHTAPSAVRGAPGATREGGDGRAPHSC